MQSHARGNKSNELSESFLAVIYDMDSETVTKDIDEQPADVEVKLTPKTVLKELDRYQSMVSRYE